MAQRMSERRIYYPKDFKKMLGFSVFWKRYSTIALVLAASAAAQDVDPPARVARLNYLSGAVAMRPAFAGDWMNAEVNRPFTSGDTIHTEIDGRAELHTDIAAIRVGGSANVAFRQLTDQEIQLGLNDGDLHLHVHHLGLAETFEIDTSNAVVTLLRDGNYRLRVDSLSGTSFLVVREGTAEVNAGGQAATINPGHSVLLSGPNPGFDIAYAPGEDDFDRWCHQRNDYEAHLASARYVPPTLIGYEDLDANGMWDVTPQYGPVWYPNTVPPGWTPYRFGHWVWIKPWGWTWMDQASWGFAPFHYGRWVVVNGRWGWCPGPAAVTPNAPPVHPHYAPALVAWVGGPNVSVNVAAGGGGALAWVALGFGEVYTPPYHCSPHYFNNVNVSNTRVTNTVNITNVYQTVYVNKTVYNTTYVHTSSPNAVVAMPQAALAAGRPVHQEAVVLKKEEIQNLKPAPAPVAMQPPPPQPVHTNPPPKPVPAPVAPGKPSIQQQKPTAPVPAAAPKPPVPPTPPKPVPAAAVPSATPIQPPVVKPVQHEYPQATPKPPAPPKHDDKKDPKKEEKKKDEHKDQR